MNIELINTGTELMLGRVLNTHQQWLCRQLADLGYHVRRQVAVSDTGTAIQQAVREALREADLIIVTGGLGPTSDDRTRDLIAELAGKPLRSDPAALDHLNRFYAERKRTMPERVRVQALVPEGATVLLNEHGTAPGLALELPGGGEAAPRPAWLVMLPGPPRELRPMFSVQVVPWLRRRFPLTDAFACRTLRTTGIPESIVEERIDGPLRRIVEAGLELGYCARPGEVDVRLAARGSRAESLVIEAEQITRGLLGDAIYGLDDEALEAAVIRLLVERQTTVTVAESCTGGLLGHRLTNVPGASAVFVGGWITYSNEAKEKCLGVRSETLAAFGAVSEPTAREMAEGARVRMGTDYALAVTGIAGPSGGSEAKPVGTVFIALAWEGGTRVMRNLNAFDRETFKHATAQQGLELLRRAILGLAG
jgi:nicotinamide-nucleotide amidase